MDHRRGRGRPALIRGRRRAGLFRPPRAGRLVVPSLALLVTWLTWPVASLTAGTGLDASWMAALHVAARRGTDFGDDVVFTYGPLGFLGVPRYHYPVTTALALAAVLAVRFAFAAVLLAALRRAVPLPVAAVAAYAVARLVTVETAELLVLVVLLWCLLAVRGVVALPPALAGAVAGAALLVKFNAGVACLAFAVVAVVASRRSLPRCLLGCLVAALGLWFATGNPAGALPSYLRGSWEVTAGYTAAMANELPGLGWHYAVAPLLALAVVGLATTVPVGSRRERAGLVLLVAGALALEAKRGFVRHDAHAEVFFLACALAPLALAGSASLRRLAAVVPAAAGLAVVVGSFAPDAADLRDPRTPARDLAAVATPGGRERLLAEGLVAVRDALAIDATLLDRVGDETVHVDPWHASAVWAYRLRWRPAPVFQTYSAYTPWLDDRNAARLADAARGPRYVLRAVPAPAVDDRVPSFEPPRHVLGLLCHFREVAASGRWQLLERVPGGRCGAPVPAGTLGEGGAVPEPAPGHLLYAVVRAGLPPADRLLAAVAKAPVRHVTLDGTDWRFLPYYAGRPLVLAVPPDESVLPGRREHRRVAGFALPDWPQPYVVELWQVPLSP